ncbi:MAG: Fur family transcriptional regulator [Moraxellaceae bacterium]|nr:Fur family transcriptional regulator [Moraxellaceae bacterium]MDZ4298591.1 Fur family transcriptional regulator [Moraxellaceae bacterium]MDZ4386470.1 Fur family transcriptional regulator [Moraxellaceae bacterium]
MKLSVGHDHGHCIRTALAKAEKTCTDAGVRLTPTRRRVLELIWASHKPLGAYDLLDQLSQEGHKPAPPTVYRALDFLLAQHLIHRIASLNAFTGCTAPEHSHSGYFLICQLCGNAEEIIDSPTLEKAIKNAVDAANFVVASGTLELSGTCQHCHDQH